MWQHHLCEDIPVPAPATAEQTGSLSSGVVIKPVLVGLSSGSHQCRSRILKTMRVV